MREFREGILNTMAKICQREGITVLDLNKFIENGQFLTTTKRKIWFSFGLDLDGEYVRKHYWKLGEKNKDMLYGFSGKLLRADVQSRFLKEVGIRRINVSMWRIMMHW